MAETISKPPQLQKEAELQRNKELSRIDSIGITIAKDLERYAQGEFQFVKIDSISVLKAENNLELWAVYYVAKDKSKVGTCGIAFISSDNPTVVLKNSGLIPIQLAIVEKEYTSINEKCILWKITIQLVGGEFREYTEEISHCITG